MKNFLKNLFKPKPEWEYGTCNGSHARRHLRKGNVQFILWPAGKQGHKEDFWINFDSSWWPLFKVNDKDSGPVSSGTPCSSNVDNTDRVEPL